MHHHPADTILTIYRQGRACSLKPLAGAAPLSIRLRQGLWVDESGRGEVLFYTEAAGIGLGFHTALMLGLFHVEELDAEREVGAARQREHRAAEQERLTAAVARLLRAVRGAAERHSPLGKWASRESDSETLEALAAYFERAGRNKEKE